MTTSQRNRRHTAVVWRAAIRAAAPVAGRGMIMVAAAPGGYLSGGFGLAVG